VTADAVVIRPGTAAEVAAALKEASDAGQSLIIRGGAAQAAVGCPTCAASQLTIK